MKQVDAFIVDPLIRHIARCDRKIRQFIEEEIISRYEFEKGRVENSLRYDTELQEAAKLLADPARVKSLLTTIEKPTKPFNPGKKF